MKQIKLLSIVVKNLGNPEKCNNPKYRQLRISNEKVQAKLLPCPSAMDYMEAIGFRKVTEADGNEFLRIPVDQAVDCALMVASHKELCNALEIVGGERKVSRNNSKMERSSFLEEKKTPEGIIIPSSIHSTGKTYQFEKKSEKQKARELMEKKRKKEAEDAKAVRAKNIAMLKQDKFVRENDENWKSGVSAACAKSGSGISTFRDKYGES